MDRLIFEDIAELGNFMYEVANEKSIVVSSVLFYDEAVELIKWLMQYDDIAIGSINIENEDYNGYRKEFYITLDSDLFLDVIPAYKIQDKKYIDIDADVILYGGDVNSRVAIHSECLNKFEIVMDDEFEEDESECYIEYELSYEDILNILKLLNSILE